MFWDEDLPLFHPNCRSTTCPYFEDYETPTRAARAPLTGKTYTEENLPYKEWKKKWEAKFAPPQAKTNQTIKPVKGMAKAKNGYQKLKQVVPPKEIGNIGYNDAVQHFSQLQGYQSWKANLTQDQQWAINRYTSYKFSEINAYLRSGEQTAQEIIKLTRDLEAACKAYTTENAYVVKRYTTMNFIPSEYTMIGKEIIVDKGFMSASLDHKVTEGLGSSSMKHSIEMEIYVPNQYTGAIFIGGQSIFDSEVEMLIQPSAKFKVLDVHETQLQNGLKKLTLVLEAVK